MIIARHAQAASRVAVRHRIWGFRLNTLSKVTTRIRISGISTQFNLLLDSQPGTLRISRYFSGGSSAQDTASSKKDSFARDLESISKVVELSPLQKSVFQKLLEYSIAYDQLTEELSRVKPESDSGESESSYAQSNSKSSGQNIDSLSIRNNQFQVVKEWVQQAKDCSSLLEDPNMKDLVEEEKNSLVESLAEITEEAVQSLVDKDKYDDCRSCSLEFRPGVGGGESMIFAEEMYYAYSAFCQNQGWRYVGFYHRVEQITFNKDTGIGKGIKSATMRVTGEECYSLLKCESGVHK